MTGEVGTREREAHILFFLPAEIYTQVAGESPHRKGLGYSCATHLFELFELFQVSYWSKCKCHALGLPFAPPQTQSCTLGSVGNRWLLVPVPGPRACLTLLHGSRSESGTSACYLSLLEKDDYFFPAQRQLENRKSIMSFLEVTDYPQLATPEFISVLPVPEPSPSASAGPLGQHSGFSRPVWQVRTSVCS